MLWSDGRVVWRRQSLRLRSGQASPVHALLVPIRTENEYYRKVRDAAGPAWTRAHRAAFGLDGGGAFAQAIATCALFRESMRLIDDRLDPAAREIVRRTLEILP